MKKILTLNELMPGDEAVISGVDDDTNSQERLRDMGLSDGTPLRVIKYAPLGDPIEIKIRGFHLSIRNSVAKQIRVRRRNGKGKMN
ncbi:MAG: ferrous iron transport protein A [Calditrichaceae bacterium]